MALQNYLIFDGNCAEAMNFYQGVLGGKLDVMTNGNSPVKEHVPQAAWNRVLHSALTLPDGAVLMASDEQMGVAYHGMHGFTVALDYPTVEEAKRKFDALVDGGKVTMPWSPSFWAEGFGMCVDRFGTPWIINGKLLPMQ